MIACAQVPLRAQLFLVAQRSDTNAPGPGLAALAWDPSPDTNVAGYFLCWGLASGACTNRFGVGNATGGTVGGFQTNVTYYFTVVAYGGMSQESPPSNEVSYTAPTNPPAAPSHLRILRFTSVLKDARERPAMSGVSWHWHQDGARTFLSAAMFDG